MDCAWCIISSFNNHKSIIMGPIEERNIPGVTAKGLIWIMGGIIALIVMVMGAYFGITGKLDKSSMNQEMIKTEMEIMKAEIKTVQINQQSTKEALSIIQFQVDEIKNKK